jgi:EAL domain-containing protein (putative c-di-GMP-specific phosphodiesterase class I)
LRLKDDEYGFISPELFIPVAEKSGAIHRIGTYVLEEVCRFIASDEYRALQMDYIEINLSVTQCMRPNLAQEVLEIMNRYGVKPDQINLEITETAASYSQNTMMENIETLTDAGISFSLDDYGTGYSNMRRIASMPFSIVKLDKSFINADRNPRIEIILENTIHMIKDMNMKIVVEGIETAELVQQFSDLKCEYIQGYYFSKPIPKEEFVSFIQNS